MKKAIIISRKKCRRTSGEEKKKINDEIKEKEKEKKRNCMIFFFFFRLFFSLTHASFPGVFQSYPCPCPSMPVSNPKCDSEKKNVKKMVGNMCGPISRVAMLAEETNVSENESPLSQASRTFRIHQYMKNFMTRYTL